MAKRGSPPKKICIHFWDIESANGETSRGVCKYCGAVKTFYNSMVFKFKATSVVHMGSGGYQKI